MSIRKFRIYSRPFNILRGKYPRKVIRAGAKGNLVLVLSQARWTFSPGIIENSALDFYRARVKATKLTSSRYTRQSLLYKKQHFFRMLSPPGYLHFKRIIPYPVQAACWIDPLKNSKLSGWMSDHPSRQFTVICGVRDKISTSLPARVTPDTTQSSTPLWKK